MEGLGSAAGTGRPRVFGFVLLRRAFLRTEQAVTWTGSPGALRNIGFFGPPRKLCADKQAFSSLLNAGSAQRRKAVPNHSGLALAASEAGRTARADADSNFVEVARPGVGLPAWHRRELE